MAEASSGVSGSGSSQNSSAAQSQAAAEAAESQEAQMAAGLTAVNATPTPGLMGVAPAAVDLSISVSALSQLNTMQVSTPTLSSIPTLGGVPMSYAAVAMNAPATPSPLSVELTGYDPADPNLAETAVTVGLSFPNAIDTTLAMRMGLDPFSAKLSATLSTTNELNSFSVMSSITLGGPNTPSYSISASGTAAVGNLDTVSFSAAANFSPNSFQSLNVTAGYTHGFSLDNVSLTGFGNFGPDGFQSAGVTAGYDHAFSDTTKGTASVTATFDGDGLNGFNGAIGINQGPLGVVGRVNHDVRTGVTTGFVGVDGKWKF